MGEMKMCIRDRVAVDRGFGDVQLPGDLPDGALGLEYPLRFQRAEYLQLVGGMHGLSLIHI